MKITLSFFYLWSWTIDHVRPLSHNLKPKILLIEWINKKIWSIYKSSDIHTEAIEIQWHWFLKIIFNIGLRIIQCIFFEERCHTDKKNGYWCCVEDKANGSTCLASIFMFFIVVELNCIGISVYIFQESLKSTLFLWAFIVSNEMFSFLH